MGGWRIKFLFVLIVYFAGFATAIYCLAPVPEEKGYQRSEVKFTYPALKKLKSNEFASNEFAQSFNAGMHKCLGFGKEAAKRMTRYIKQKFEERHAAGYGMKD